MRVSVSSIIAKPADVLFWLSQDYTRRLEWDKYLCEAYLLGGHETAAVGIGLIARIDVALSLYQSTYRFVPLRTPLSK